MKDIAVKMMYQLYDHISFLLKLCFFVAFQNWGTEALIPRWYLHAHYMTTDCWGCLAGNNTHLSWCFLVSCQLVACPASREMLDRCWANVVTFVGAMSGNDVGPMRICPSVQRWHNVVTPPTMTLCQRFANVITYCILLYFMVGTTFAHCLYEWLAKHWHNFIIAHCLSTITIKITSFIWKAVA